MHATLDLQSPQNVVPALWPPKVVWRDRLGGILMHDFSNLRGTIMHTKTHKASIQKSGPVDWVGVFGPLGLIQKIPPGQT